MTQVLRLEHDVRREFTSAPKPRPLGCGRPDRYEELGHEALARPWEIVAQV